MPIAEISVRRGEYIEPAFAYRKELAVGEPGPTQLESCFDLMFGDVFLERAGRSLVEQDPHPDRALRGLYAASRVLEDGVNLLARGAGEPLQKLVHRSAPFQILEQCA